MPSGSQSDLADRADTQPVARIEQYTDLDSVAGGERKCFQEATSRGVFPAQRLEDAGEFGPKRRQ